MIRKIIAIVLVLVVLAACSSPPEAPVTPPPAEVGVCDNLNTRVSFENAALRAAVENELGITGPDITCRDMMSLHVLEHPTSGGTITSLKGLEAALNLETVRIPNEVVEDLEPLRGLKHLAQLDVSGNPIASLDPLREVTSLERLVAGDVGITSLAALGNLARLNHLDIRGNDAITDFAVLGNLTQLETVALPGKHLTSTVVSSHFPNMRNFTMVGAGPLTDLASLAPMKNQLEKVSLINTNITDMSAIFGAPELTALTVQNSPVTSIGGSFGALTELTLEKTQIENLHGFSAPELWNVTIRYNTSLADISGLFASVELTAINAERNAIDNLMGIDALVHLKSLKLDGNALTNLAPLATMHHLTRLLLFENCLDLTPISADWIIVDDLLNNRPSGATSLYLGLDNGLNIEDITQRNCL